MKTNTQVLEPEVLAPEDGDGKGAKAEAKPDAIAQKFITAADGLLRQYQGFTVTSEVEYEAAGATVVDLKAQIKAAETERDSWVRPLNSQVKRLNELFKAPQTVYQKVVDIISGARLAYERAKQAEAERLRKEQEEAAKREQARLDKLALERAARAEKRGDHDKAEEILQTVPQVAMPVGPVELALPKTSGLTKVKYWYGTVQDKLAFLTALAAGEIPLEAIPDKAWEAIDGWVTARARAGARGLAGCAYREVEQEKGTGR